jgi:DNA-binding GntR family transcriptional regulator
MKSPPACASRSSRAQLAPGSFLDEVALCERLEISRTPLREALKVLTAEGLLRHEPRRGCFVNEVTERDLDEIFPVIALAGRALRPRGRAKAASDADVVALETLHERLQRATRRQGASPITTPTNHAIHEAFITLADNRWLAQVIGDLRKILALAPAKHWVHRGACTKPERAHGGVCRTEAPRQRRRRSGHAHPPDAPARRPARSGA